MGTTTLPIGTITAGVPDPGNPYAGGAYCASSDRSGPVGATITGTAQISYTWTHSGTDTDTTDPPPPCVIVNESSTATFTVWCHGEFGYSVSTGMANDPGTGGYYDEGDLVSFQTTGNQYEVKDSSSGSFTVTSPSFDVEFSGDMDDNREWSSGVSATFAAGVSNISINPMGATQDSSLNWDILVGQKCSPTVNGIPGALTVNSYAWTVSGTTFQTWSNATPAINGNPANLNASYELDGPGPLNVAAPSWYWNDPTGPTSETITCSIAVTPPTGQGSAFTVSPTVKATVYLPTFTAIGFAGNVQVNASEPDANGTYYLWAGPTASLPAGCPAGMNWRSTVTTPTTPVAFGHGQLEYVQTWTPTYSKTDMGITIPFPKAGDPATGLDSVYPYVAAWSESPNMNYFSDDAPDIKLTDSVTYAKLSGSFQTYLLYMPPGSGSTWVPLANLSWKVNGEASQPGSGGWANYFSTNGTDVAGTVTGDGPFTNSNTFPNWLNIL